MTASATASGIDFIVEGAVARLRLNRPEKHNAMHLPMWTAFAAALKSVPERPEIRCVIIEAAGENFTSGIDLAALMALGQGFMQEEPVRARARLRETILRLQDCFTAIEQCPVPVIAAVKGACIGAGIDMISACDMRYCTADAWFCIQEINIGMVADVGTLQRLPHIIPEGLARELAYTGRKLHPAEARAAGLVNAVYEDETALRVGVGEIARTIAEKSPMAIRGTKEMLNYTRDHSVADALNYISVWNAAMLMGEDLNEQMSANAAKRPARFKDPLPPARLD